MEKKRELVENEILKILRNPQKFLSDEILKAKGGLPVGILWEETYERIKSIEEMKKIIKKLLKEEKISLVGPCIKIKGREMPSPKKNLDILLRYINMSGISFVFDIVKIKEGVTNA